METRDLGLPLCSPFNCRYGRPWKSFLWPGHVPASYVSERTRVCFRSTHRRAPARLQCPRRHTRHLPREGMVSGRTSVLVSVRLPSLFVGLYLLEVSPASDFVGLYLPQVSRASPCVDEGGPHGPDSPSPPGSSHLPMYLPGPGSPRPTIVTLLHFSFRTLPSRGSQR